jgi:predicted metal-dependent enzyme (double-stranded beta helix superfamily)
MNRRELIGFLAGIPAFTLLADEIAAANELGSENVSAEDAGQVGTKLLFENEKVKVWEFALSPGELIAMHTHRMDYIFHVYEGSTLEVTYPAEMNTPARQLELKAGDVRFVNKGGRHAARNAGKQRYVEVLIELKS